MAEARFDGDGAKTIDQLVKEEKLSQQSGANLKAAYDTLLETLKESQDRERQDLLRVKELSDRLKGGNDAGPAREGGADGAGSAEAQDDNNLAALDSEGPSNNRIAELRRDLADRSAQVAVKQHELSSLEEQLERLKIESEELEHEASGEALNEAETDGEELSHIALPSAVTRRKLPNGSSKSPRFLWRLQSGRTQWRQHSSRRSRSRTSWRKRALNCRSRRLHRSEWPNKPSISLRTRSKA